MNIKAILQKPCTDDERFNFIVEYNHNQGFSINETDTELQALGYTKEELEQQEKKRIANLKLTKREVFLAIYKDLGITPDEIKTGISNPEALIEFEYANEYYRGNPLIDSIGTSLGYTKEDLDYLFEFKSFPEPKLTMKEAKEDEMV